MTTLTQPVQISAARRDEPPLHASPPLDAGLFREIRRRMVLSCCKWDPQVGDTGTLADFALLLSPGIWPQLATWAEQLATETLAAEAELMRRPDLHRRLGVPRAIRAVLSRAAEEEGLRRSLPRIMRFDFHWTASGWRISEVNADVPGGFTESSSFTPMIAPHCNGHVPTGDPASRWAECIARTGGRRVGLLWAAGFMEDYQVVAYLARRLEADHGCACHLLGPQQVRWRNGRAHVLTADGDLPLDVIVRFYQAEWLSRLPCRTGWSHFFHGSATPVLNPGAAMLVESKRLPLVWKDLHTDMSTWRRLLPETVEPRHAPWRFSDEWIVKTAYSNNGDSVLHRSMAPRRQWRRTMLDVMLHRRDWLAQRRFDAIAVETPRGPMYPCLGVYVIDGRAEGIYGRISPKPIIDYQAIDVAVLAPAEDVHDA